MERRIQRTQRQNSKNRKASELSAENRGRQWASSHPKPAAIPKLPKENTRYADREATNRTAAQKSSARSRSNREPSKAVDQEKTGSEKASRLGDKSSDISDHTPSPQVGKILLTDNIFFFSRKIQSFSFVAKLQGKLLRKTTRSQQSTVGDDKQCEACTVRAQRWRDGEIAFQIHPNMFSGL